MTKDELGVIAANLSALTGAAASVYERRLAHLCGLARVFRGGTLSDTLRGEYQAFSAGLAGDAPGAPRLGAFRTLCSRADRLELCRFIYGNLGQNETPPTAEELLGCHPSDGGEDVSDRISYLRNYYADRAYSIFASVLDSPTVMYSTDFTGVCEDVYYGRAKYCILPVESSTDGILSGFRALVGKYELNLALSCDVQTQDEDMYTRFALIRRGISPPPAAAGECRFEFSATFGDGEATLCDILDAADAFGLRLCRINSLPVSYSGRSGAYDLAFACESGSLPEFVTFLSLEVPQFTAIGIYRHIKSPD